MREENQRDSAKKRDRGASQQVALVLLLGLVFMGASVVVTVGLPVFDLVESQAERERAQLSLDVADHGISTTVETGVEQTIPWGDAHYNDDGTVAVSWYDDDGGGPDPFEESSTTVTVETLGAIEYPYSGGTVVYQSGAKWDHTRSETLVRSPPPVTFDDGLSLSFEKISEEDARGDEATVYVDDTGLEERLATAQEIATDEGYSDFAVQVASEYADGWESHFETELEDATEWNTTVERDGDTVTVTLEGIEDVPEGGNFFIKEDHGLAPQSEGHSIDNNILVEGSPPHQFHIDATLTNSGYEPRTVTADLSIKDETGTIETRTIESRNEISGGEKIRTSDQEEWDGGNHLFDLQSQGTKSIDLSPGEKYTYDIEVSPGDDTLDEPGTFYYLHEEAHYTVVDTWTSADGDERNVSADVRNLGDGPRESQNVTLEISPEGKTDTVSSSTEVELDSLESETISWTVDESKWPKGEYEFVVETDDDHRGGTFEIETGGAFEIAEDRGIDGSGAPSVTGGDDVTVGVNVTSSYTDERTQNVTLEVFDSNGDTVRSTDRPLTVGGGETAAIDLTVDPLDNGGVYEYDISTETDGLNDLGSFLVLDQSADFAIESATIVGDPVTPGDTLEVEAAIDNQGEAGEQFVWLESFDGDTVAVEEIDLESGESTTTTLQWGHVTAPDTNSDTILSVQTSGDEEPVPVDIAPLLEVTDVTVPDDAVAPGESAVVEAEVESVAGDATQEVVLERADGSQLDSRTVTVSDGVTETVALEYDDVGERTERVTVRTGDDEMDDVVVVVRDGAVCSDVSYEGSGTSDDPYQIHNVDQLQCINEDLDAHYELVDDIDAHGTKYWNDGAGFEPIGPEGHDAVTIADDGPWDTFDGEFDGNGNTIQGLYINRPDEDFVGLFGATGHPFDDRAVGEGSTVANVVLEDVHVVGNMYVGGLVGQAGGEIRNARAEGYVEADKQLVGGLIGLGAHADIDNRIVADVEVVGGDVPSRYSGIQKGNAKGIGGLIGRAAWETEIAVGYSQGDVTGPINVGGVMGSSSLVDSQFEELYSTAEVSATDGDAGAVAGIVQSEGDIFEDSIYWDETITASPFGEAERIGFLGIVDMNIEEVKTTDWQSRTTGEMQGIDVNQDGRMGNLEFEEEGGPWVAIPEEYPRFAWELAAEGAFDVTIDDVENVTAGETAEIEVTVTSRYQDREESDVTQTIVLEDPDGQTVDTRTVTLESYLEDDDQTTISLALQTETTDDGVADISVQSEDTRDIAPIEIFPTEHGPGSSGSPTLGPEPGDGVLEGGDDPSVGPGSSSSDGLSERDSAVTIDADEIRVT